MSRLPEMIRLLIKLGSGIQEWRSCLPDTEACPESKQERADVRRVEQR